VEEVKDKVSYGAMVLCGVVCFLDISFVVVVVVPTGGQHSTENIPFLLDIDSTLLTRCKNVGEDDAYLENDEYINDSFECIPLLFKFQPGHCVVVFRYRVGAFLRFLTKRGRVCLVTHACEVYANRLAKFLEKQTECGHLLVRCVRKTELKLPPLLSDNCTPSTTLLIVDDKPARWDNISAEQTTEISSLTEDNFRNDVELQRLLVLVNEAEFSSSIVKFDLANAAKDRDDLNFENPIPKSKLFRCPRCDKWMALIIEDGNADSVKYSPCPFCTRHFDSSSDEEEEIVKVK
jgi:hypothetical protein